MRLFIATSFPEPVTRDLNEHVAAVRPKLPPASWVRPETQHLTLAFLGERDAALIETLGPALQDRLRGIGRFDAVLARCGFFPNRRRARAGWIGLEPEQPFKDAALAIRDVVTGNGIELDRADFRPHLTLMRIRATWPPAAIEMFERAFGGYRSAPFVVDTVTLYSSRLNPTGAVHTAVRGFALA